MEVKIVDGKLVVSFPICEQRSKSGKTMLIATTNGAAKGVCQFKGKPVELNLNAYYKP
jgi:hypothetical protein